jgi:hypothetical protein
VIYIIETYPTSSVGFICFKLFPCFTMFLFNIRYTAVFVYCSIKLTNNDDIALSIILGKSMIRFGFLYHMVGRVNMQVQYIILGISGNQSLIRFITFLTSVCSILLH